MAEERIIDDDTDKNKKYRIVKGEDGEDELIINEVEDETELSYEEPDEYVTDEEMGVLTAEQYEAAMALKAEEEERAKQRIAELRERVRTYMDGDKFNDALECIEAAEELVPNDGEVKCAKLEAITFKFTDFSATKDIKQICDEIHGFASDEQRSPLFEKYGAAVKKLKDENEAALNDVNENYLAQQQSRREVLAPRKAKATKIFVAVFAVFIAFLIAAIVCSTMMFSMQNGLMLVVTIILAVIAFISLVALVFASRSFVAAARMSAANERDYSTKLGRERAVLGEYGSVLTAVYSAISVNKDDIS